jgi:hypothetical protein
LEYQIFYKYVPICTWSVLDMYLVCTLPHVLVRAQKNKVTNARDFGNQTVDLMHSIMRAIPPSYQRAFHGDTHEKTRYTAIESYTLAALYLLSVVGRPARVQQRPQLLP